ncbi:MAG: hypothetical protein JWL69_2043 [Phycisphaerales bacterium]|nr:hypothetical protein [Phycisphaerales bacterium]
MRNSLMVCVVLVGLIAQSLGDHPKDGIDLASASATSASADALREELNHRKLELDVAKGRVMKTLATSPSYVSAEAQVRRAEDGLRLAKAQTDQLFSARVLDAVREWGNAKLAREQLVKDAMAMDPTVTELQRKVDALEPIVDRRIAEEEEKREPLPSVDGAREISLSDLDKEGGRFVDQRIALKGVQFDGLFEVTVVEFFPDRVAGKDPLMGFAVTDGRDLKFFHACARRTRWYNKLQSKRGTKFDLYGTVISVRSSATGTRQEVLVCDRIDVNDPK